MSEPDQAARDLAWQAMAKVEQHMAVCLEAEKRRAQFEADMRAWMERIQVSYETGVEAIRIAVTGARQDGVTEAAKVQAALLLRIAERDREINDNITGLYNRFWALALAYGGSLTVLAAWLFAKTQHWV